MHILDYIENLPNNSQSDTIKYLHQFIASYPDIKSKIMFTTPFYTRNKWLMYSNKLKNGTVELCFVNAKLFTNHLEYLDFKKRKQVAGITYKQVTDIDENVVDLLINEAIRVDNLFKSTFKKITKR